MSGKSDRQIVLLTCYALSASTLRADCARRQNSTFVRLFGYVRALQIPNGVTQLALGIEERSSQDSFVCQD